MHWADLEVEPGDEVTVWFRRADNFGLEGGYVYSADGRPERGCGYDGCDVLRDLGGGWWAYLPVNYIH